MYDWGIDLKNLTLTWSGGCIIRSRLLALIRAENSDNLDQLFKIETFMKALIKSQKTLTQTMSSLTLSNRAYPCLHSSVDYLKYMMTQTSSANLIQAQRDYFGAHTYKRADDPEGPAHHTLW